MATFKTNSNSYPLVADFVAGILHCLTNVRMMHWSATRYSTHQALGEFYDELSDNIDQFVEEFQGRYQLLNLKSAISSFEASDLLPDKYLELARGNVEAIRRAEGFPQDSSLQNVVDELVGSIDRTVYKLRFLA